MSVPFGVAQALVFSQRYPVRIPSSLADDAKACTANGHVCAAFTTSWGVVTRQQLLVSMLAWPSTCSVQGMDWYGAPMLMFDMYAQLV